MAGGEGRRLWVIVFRNFINSFKPRQTRGTPIGKDYLGNSYFEIAADPSTGKRKPSRWYAPPEGKDFTDIIPSEWEAWLRMRRIEPPKEDEIARNVAIAEMKKVNAAKLEEKRLAEGGSLPTMPAKGPETFPKYEGFSHSGDALK